jgi:hypothetical protein
MEAKKNNVIQFPGTKKTESSAPAAPEAAKTPATPEPGKPKRKKAATVLGLSVLMAGSLFANRWQGDGSAEMSSTAGGRGIASVSTNVIMPGDRDSQWEHSLAKDLANRPRRELASVRLGQRPSLEEKLNFSLLKSQYSISMQGGKLAQVQWTESSTETPVYLKDRSAFLLEYKDLMPVNFEAAVPVGSVDGKDKIQETFALIDGTQTKVAEVHFDLDGYKRLRGIKVVPSTLGQ